MTIEERSISILGANVISFHPLEIVVAFDEPVKMRNPFTVSTRVEHVAIPLEGEWKATGSNSELGSVWIFQQAPGAVYGPTVEIIIFSDDVCAVRAGSKLLTAVCYELETLNQNLEDISGRLGRLMIGKNLMYDVTKRIGPISGPDDTLETQVAHRKHPVTSLTESDSLDDRVALLDREISAVRDLIELEPDCKCKITVVFICERWLYYRMLMMNVNVVKAHAISFMHSDTNTVCNDILILNRANSDPVDVVIRVAQDSQHSLDKGQGY
jgi:hypothetical protein